MKKTLWELIKMAITITIKSRKVKIMWLSIIIIPCLIKIVAYLIEKYVL